jgi:thiol-disulfide isomerase/thioredoxin/DNA-binding beta-propeller fold protein YncE
MNHHEDQSFFMVLILAFSVFLLHGFYNHAFAQSPLLDVHLTENTEPIMTANAHQLLLDAKPKWLNTIKNPDLHTFKERILLLDFWTYCCINCLHVIPDLHQLEKEFGSALTVIGIHSGKFHNEQDDQAIRDAMQRYDIHHPVINDAAFDLWNKFRIQGWPSFVLIAPDGSVRGHISGEGQLPILRYHIQQLLKQFPETRTAGPIPTTLPSISPHLEANQKPILSFPTKIIWVEKTSYHPEGLLIADTGNHRILWVDMDGNIRYQIGGIDAGFQDGSATEARFSKPHGIAYRDGMIYVADTGNHAIRLIHIPHSSDAKQTASSIRVSTVAGTGKRGFELFIQQGPALSTSLASPWDIGWVHSHLLVIAMAGSHQIWTLDTKHSLVSVLAGNGQESINNGEYPHNTLSQPSALTMTPDGIYILDSETSALRLLKSTTLSTIIGTGLFDFGYKDGHRKDAQMQHPLGLSWDPISNTLLIADSFNHAIRQYNPKTHYLSTLLDSTKTKTPLTSGLKQPEGITQNQSFIFIANTNAHRIERLDRKTHQLIEFSIKPTQQNNHPIGPTNIPLTYHQFEQELPNNKWLDPFIISSNSQHILELSWEKPWGLNQTAPSTLTLYQSLEGKMIPLHLIPIEHIIEGKIILPPLEEGDYALAAMLFYCQKDNNAQCHIRSLKGNIKVQKTDSNRQEKSINHLIILP